MTEGRLKWKKASSRRHSASKKTGDMSSLGLIFWLVLSPADPVTSFLVNAGSVWRVYLNVYGGSMAGGEVRVAHIMIHHLSFRL